MPVSIKTVSQNSPQISPQKSPPPQESQITSTRIYELKSPENNIANKNSKINNRNQERISSSTNKSSILQQLHTTNRTEQIDNNQIQKEGEKSRRNNKESKKSYADVVSLTIRHPTTINISTKPNTTKPIYPPQNKNLICCQNRNYNKHHATNNNSYIQNKIPNHHIRNIQHIPSTNKTNLNIRKCAHQQGQKQK